MSQLDVQNILTGIAQGQTRRAQEFQAQIEQQKADQENQYRQDMLKKQDEMVANERDRIQNEHAVQMASIDHLKTATKLGVQQRLQDLADAASQNKTIAGATPINGPLAAGTAGQMVPSIDPDTGNTTQVPIYYKSPTQQATEDSDLQRIKDAPAVEKSNVEKQAANDFAIKLADHNNIAKARLEQNLRNQAEAGENYRERLRMGLIPGMTDNGSPGAIDNQNLINAVSTGAITREGLNKQFPSRGAQAVFQDTLSKHGIIPLSDKQKKWLDDSAQILKGIMPLQGEYLQTQSSNDPSSGALGRVGQSLTGRILNNSWTNPDFDNAQRNLANVTPQLAKIFSDAPRGATQAEINTFKNNSPSPNREKVYNAKQFGTQNKMILDKIDTELSGFSPEQTEAIKHSLGLHLFNQVPESMIDNGYHPSPSEIILPHQQLRDSVTLPQPGSTLPGLPGQVISAVPK